VNGLRRDPKLVDGLQMFSGRSEKILPTSARRWTLRTSVSPSKNRSSTTLEGAFSDEEGKKAK
jgi:hypothetical protein